MKFLVFFLSDNLFYFDTKPKWCIDKGSIGNFNIYRINRWPWIHKWLKIGIQQKTKASLSPNKFNFCFFLEFLIDLTIKHFPYIKWLYYLILNNFFISFPSSLLPFIKLAAVGLGVRSFFHHFFQFSWLWNFYIVIT